MVYKKLKNRHNNIDYLVSNDPLVQQDFDQIDEEENNDFESKILKQLKLIHEKENQLMNQEFKSVATSTSEFFTTFENKT